MTAVTGRWVTADGQPADGYIRFTLHPSAVNSGGEQVTCAPVYGILDGDGQLSVDLIPDSDLVVDGTSVYRVDEFVTDCRRSWWLILTDGEPVDLPSRYPGADSTRQERLDYLHAVGVHGVDALSTDELLDLIRDLADTP